MTNISITPGEFVCFNDSDCFRVACIDGICQCAIGVTGDRCEIPVQISPFYVFLIIMSLIGVLVVMFFDARRIYRLYRYGFKSIVFQVHVTIMISLIFYFVAVLDFDGVFGILDWRHSIICLQIALIFLQFSAMTVLLLWSKILKLRASSSSKSIYLEKKAIFFWLVLAGLFVSQLIGSYAEIFRYLVFPDQEIYTGFIFAGWLIALGIMFMILGFVILKKVKQVKGGNFSSLKKGEKNMIMYIGIFGITDFITIILLVSFLFVPKTLQHTVIVLHYDCFFILLGGLILLIFRNSVEKIATNSSVGSEESGIKTVSSEEKDSDSDIAQFKEFLGHPNNSSGFLEVLNKKNKSKVLYFLAIDKMVQQQDTLLGNSLLVYQKYIKEGAPFPVPISKELQQEITHKLEPFFSEDMEEDLTADGIPLNLFKQIQSDVLTGIFSEFEIFKTTQDYKKLLKNTETAQNLAADSLQLFV